MIKSTSTTTKQKNRTRFTVPIFPHVRKFILKNYKVTDPIKVEDYNVLGKMVTLALRDNRKRVDYNDQYRDRLTASITIVLSKDQADLGPRIGKLIRINIHMDLIFKEHLLCWINALKGDGIPVNTACKMFLEYYNIEEKEYSLDAAYKYYQRST